uniref:Uncharacterized protein n=1 Tax=Anguilla anguilla TaxID=7936 RepID=A0A0E9WSY8_ANGAN
MSFSRFFWPCAQVYKMIWILVFSYMCVQALDLKRTSEKLKNSLEAGKMCRSQRVFSETFYLLQYSQIKAKQVFIL